MAVTFYTTVAPGTEEWRLSPPKRESSERVHQERYNLCYVWKEVQFNLCMQHAARYGEYRRVAVDKHGVRQCAAQFPRRKPNEPFREDLSTGVYSIGDIAACLPWFLPVADDGKAVGLRSTDILVVNAGA